MTKFDNSTQRVNSIFLKINQTLIKLKFNIDFAFSGGTAYNIQRGEYMELCVVDNKFLKENGPVVGDTRSDWTGDYWNNDWSSDYN